jgi:predicted flap endonuclease-1-like 5' DNA nuclease
VSAAEETVVEAPVAATAALVEVTEAPGEAPVEITDVPAEAPNEIGDAVAEVVSGAEEMAADALAETGAQGAVLGAAVANKVAEAVPSEALDEVAGAADDSGNVNILDAVVKEIQETYSLQDIAKFKEKLEFVEGIGPAYAAKLNAAGINTVLDLLQRGATRKGRLDLAEATGIAGKLILKWVNHADLYRIKGVGSEYADLLEAAGVDTVVELAHRNPANLLNTVLETNKVRSLVRKEPVASQLEDWVTQAKELPRIIQY